MRNKAPRVWLQSYKLKSNQVLNRFKNYVEVVKGSDPRTFYTNLYKGVVDKEDDFNIPFFNDSIRSFSNEFGDTFQNGFGGSDGVGTTADQIVQQALSLGSQGASVFGVDNIKNAGKQALKGDASGAVNTLTSGMKSGGDPGTYIETPKFYQYAPNDGPLEVSFVLSNTLNSDSIKKNHDLVKHLTKINRPERQNSITMDPPRIYTVLVPGHRRIPWAYCSSFGVNLLGTKREIDGVIVPEAYQITMSFTSLTVEAANFMDFV
jgi:hypothetical protein